MTEKELSQFGLLEEFSITELEQRLEFEAWCDGNCDCQPTDGSCPVNFGCVPINTDCDPGPVNQPCVPEI